MHTYTHIHTQLEALSVCQLRPTAQGNMLSRVLVKASRGAELVLGVLGSIMWPSNKKHFPPCPWKHTEQSLGKASM
eukprot:1018826-Pelagomonas_calceolata.AAC.1